MKRNISLRMQQVQTPVIPVVGQWISQHPGTISLGQGVVHYSPPPEVLQAVATAVTSDSQVSCYGQVQGMEELLEAAAAKLAAENRVEMARDESRVLSTAGSNMGFLNAVLAVADVNDEVILLRPFYFNHEMAIEIAGCKPVIVSTDTQYQIDMPAVEAAITPVTRAIVTVSPNNPTGAVYSETLLTAVNQLCKSRGIYHISDEAYEYFVYGERRHFSPASLPDSHAHTISLYSLSKAYGMAGWRSGYMVIPAHLETAVKKIQDTNLICPPIVSQLAATAALRVGSDWCNDKIRGFEDIRNMVLAELSELDHCRVPPPDGAFYALMQLETEQDDMTLVERLIRDFGVAVMPGRAFGVSSGCSLRVAYGALDRQTVAEGIGRLTRGLNSLL